MHWVCGGVGGKGCVGSEGGGVVVLRASSLSRPFFRAPGDGGLSVKWAHNQIIPVFLIKGFLDPILEGAVVVNSNFRDVSKEKANILDNIILVVKEGATNSANIITGCSQHLLGRAVVWPAYCFSKKVKLTGSNHVTHGYKHFGPRPLLPPSPNVV